jgi:hypothetical protein
LQINVFLYPFVSNFKQSNGSDIVLPIPTRKKSILHNPLTPEQQQQALQQVEPITQQPTFGMVFLPSLYVSPSIAAPFHSPNHMLSFSLTSLQHLSSSSEIKNSFAIFCNYGYHCCFCSWSHTILPQAMMLKGSMCCEKESKKEEGGDGKGGYKEHKIQLICSLDFN